MLVAGKRMRSRNSIPISSFLRSFALHWCRSQIQSSLVKQTDSVASYLSHLRQILPKPEGFACNMLSCSLTSSSLIEDSLLKDCHLTREDCVCLAVSYISQYTTAGTTHYLSGHVNIPISRLLLYCILYTLFIRS